MRAANPLPRNLEHLLLKLVENEAPDLLLIFGRFSIRPDTITNQLQKSLNTFKRGNGRTPALTPILRRCSRKPG